MELNLDFLLNHKLSPNQFTILNILLKYSRWSNIEATLTLLESGNEDLVSLEKKGFIKKANKGYTITEDGKELLTDGSLFSELLEVFPTKVTRPDGNIAYLKKDRSRSQTRYHRITRNRRDIHEHILNCLKFEVKERTLKGDLKWMKTLPNWLQSEGWLEWQDRLKATKFNVVEDEEITPTPYGTKLI
jgi:DNA-binding PadR family transcriptional regulator